jgi:hypothetical protein
MRQRFCLIILMIPVLYSVAISCDKADNNINTENRAGGNNNHDSMNNSKINIKIGSKIFKATLLNNSSAKAFKAMLPVTLNMSELNGNEKFHDFSNNLPSNASNPATIQSGDIMLYGARTLVLFYKTFSTSYSYTRIGKVDDLSGYAAALGSGNVTVTYESE